MALSYDLDWEIRTTGDNTNGGAYKRTGTGTDYSQQDVQNCHLQIVLLPLLVLQP